MFFANITYVFIYFYLYKLYIIFEEKNLHRYSKNINTNLLKNNHPLLLVSIAVNISLFNPLKLPCLPGLLFLISKKPIITLICRVVVSVKINDKAGGTWFNHVPNYGHLKCFQILTFAGNTLDKILIHAYHAHIWICL